MTNADLESKAYLQLATVIQVLKERGKIATGRVVASEDPWPIVIKSADLSGVMETLNTYRTFAYRQKDDVLYIARYHATTFNNRCHVCGYDRVHVAVSEQSEGYIDGRYVRQRGKVKVRNTLARCIMCQVPVFKQLFNKPIILDNNGREE